jgi:stage V sporulation protein B
MERDNFLSDHNSAFIRGAAVLALTGIAARIIGAVFRVVLAAILGDEGIGLYQYAYPIYSTLLVLSTAGIPVALSKIMAEKIALKDYREAERVFKIAFFILALSGLLISLVMFFGSRFISIVLIKDIKAVYPLMAIAPAIFFVTIMASLRGFFQGQQNMVPTAVSQLLEQLVRVGFSITLVFLLIPIGLEYAAAGATSGAAAGGLAGLLLLAALYLKNRNSLKELGVKQKDHHPESVGQIISLIFRLAVPVTIGGLVIPLITMIDLAIVPRQLIAAGFELEEARALYGQLTGMAGSVVYFPNIIALALSMSLVPAISEAYALQNRVQIQSRTALAIKLTILFSLPAALGLYLLAEPVTVLLFNNAEAGYALAYMSWSVIPLCLYVATTGLIQGLGKPIVPALNMFYGGLVKTALAWYLTAIPTLNVGGAALASVVGLAVAAVLNLLYVKRETGWVVNRRALLFLPLFSTFLMSVVVYFCFSGIMRLGSGFSSQGLLNALAVFISILAGFFIYGLALLFSGGLNRAELVMVPYIGKSLAGLAGRFGFLK